ncbi:MAG: type II toxin-antitoxin system VapC family toxin [Nanoarchaeota archaeon]
MKIFIDTNIFLDMFFHEVKGQYNKIFNNKDNHFYTNTLVLNEVRFKLLFILAAEKLQSTKKYLIIKEIKKNSTLRELAFSRFLDFLATVSAHCKILPLLDDYVESYTLTKELGLLPTDADIIMSMRREGITTILTTDEDFNDIPGIQVLKP